MPEQPTSVARRLATAPLLAALLVQLIGCAAPDGHTDAHQVWTLTGQTMGTTYAVSIVGEPGPGRERETRLAIDRRLALVNARMSTYDPTSELSRFNASESTDWFPVSEETASVVGYALALAEDSGGAFDPTVGPVVDLWGFGPGRRRTAPPTDDEIAAARERVGHTLVESRPDPPMLRKSRPDVRIDLSAVAKGHGVDVVGELLESLGHDAYLVEIGGEVRARGQKPGGDPWRIGVERADSGAPESGARRLQRVVELHDRSLATSGDYRNFFLHEGRRYSHTVDAKTGRPVGHALATVSVLAEDCRTADATATALLVLGAGEGYDWAVGRGVAALFVSREADDSLTERATPEWELLSAVAPTPRSTP